MTVTEESRKCIEKGFSYIQPYRLAEITKTAHKIVDLLMQNGAVGLSYEDMRVCMEIVDAVLSKGITEKKNAKTDNDSEYEYEDKIAIYKYRTALHMSQAQLAKLVGVVPSTINQYENGVRKPDIVMLKKLAQVLHTTVDELLEPIECDN